ncbi:unnamed protein product [Umbelopsis ramanniana]
MFRVITNAWPIRSANKRKDDGKQVFVNVYDMIEPCTLTNFGYFMGVGIFHSGVEVNGREYCYGGHPYDFSGVFVVEPKVGPPGVLFKQSINMGYIDLDEDKITELIQTLSGEYSGNSYNLLNRNCNHFTADLCNRLTGKTVPGWINRAAKLGTMFPCVLPAEWIDPPECDFTDGEDRENSLSPAMSFSSNTPLRGNGHRTTDSRTSYSSTTSKSGKSSTRLVSTSDVGTRKDRTTDSDTRSKHSKAASSSMYSDRKQSSAGLEPSERGKRASSINSNTIHNTSLPRRSSTPTSVRLSHSVNDTDSDLFVIPAVSPFSDDDEYISDSGSFPIKEPNSARPEVVRSATQLSLKASAQELEKQ